jgi:hypothetical protein
MPSPYTGGFTAAGYGANGNDAVLASFNSRLNLQRGDVIQDAGVTPKVWSMLATALPGQSTIGIPTTYSVYGFP